MYLQKAPTTPWKHFASSLPENSFRRKFKKVCNINKQKKSIVNITQEVDHQLIEKILSYSSHNQCMKIMLSLDDNKTITTLVYGVLNNLLFVFNTQKFRVTRLLVYVLRVQFKVTTGRLIVYVRKPPIYLYTGDHNFTLVIYFVTPQKIIRIKDL